ncbi:5226_t:CDS:2, partial [Racocetra fulgida]
MDQKSVDPKSFIQINIPSKSAKRRSSNSNSTIPTSLQYNKHDLQNIKKELKTNSTTCLTSVQITVRRVEALTEASFMVVFGSPSIHRLGSPFSHRTGSPSIHKTGSPSIHKSTSKEKGSKKRGSSIKAKKDDS